MFHDPLRPPKEERGGADEIKTGRERATGALDSALWSPDGTTLLLPDGLLLHPGALVV